MAWLATPVGVVTEEGRVICEAPIHYLDSAKDWDKNARLIAAAPDLLACVKELTPLWGGEVSDQLTRRARAAVAKATGA